jgi:hypothetical protein
VEKAALLVGDTNPPQEEGRLMKKIQDYVLGSKQHSASPRESG